MRAMVFDRYGEPDVMSLGRRPSPNRRMAKYWSGVSIHPTRTHARARAHALAIDYEASIFHS
jgi:hypothetical protein